MDFAEGDKMWSDRVRGSSDRAKMMMDVYANMLEARRRYMPETDTFPVPADGPYALGHRRLDAFVKETVAQDRYWARNPDITRFASAVEIIKAPPAERADVAVAAMQRIAWYLLKRDASWERQCCDDLMEILLALPGEWRADQLRHLLEMAAGLPRSWSRLMLRSGHLFAKVEAVWAADEARGLLRPVVERLLVSFRRDTDPDARPLAERLFELVYPGAVYLEEDPWTNALVVDVAEMEPAPREAWTRLLRFLQSATGNKVSAKWLKEARAMAAALGPGEFRRQALAWLATIGPTAETGMLPPRNGDLTRGMVWLLASEPDAGIAAALGDAALASGKKIPGIGQRSAKVMNACLAALGEMPGTEPMEQLTRVRARIKYVQAQALIEKTLLGAAARRGLSPADLEELAVSTFGMEEPGMLRDELGGWTAEVRLEGGKAETSWHRAEKTQKSPPAEVKAEHGPDVAALKKTAGEMEKSLAAQRARLESLPMWERTLPYPAWRERYLDHPLMALLSRLLVWRFEEGERVRTGAWLDGALVDADDRPLDGLGEATTVGFWHPAFAAPEEVGAWRAWLDRHGITQPFKQAHRESYRVTDAERETGTYSNRFAAHILRQHQLAALCRSRGWQMALMGEYDGGSCPGLRVPGHEGLSVEFWVSAIEAEEMVAHSGVSLYVSTDSVRFYRRGQPLPLEEVPPLVFSEVMRDVDLFVGVSSIGNDPNWVDGSPYAGYWEDYSFGVLSATAETRREVLERLLPRLKIAKGVALDGRFLEVRGSLNTYRIHLGSGNVLMEPGSRYLCIVPDLRASAMKKVAAPALPFEGDSVLSVILSKAFMLAEDTKITDPTITRQLRKL